MVYQTDYFSAGFTVKLWLLAVFGRVPLKRARGIISSFRYYRSRLHSVILKNSQNGMLMGTCRGQNHFRVHQQYDYRLSPWIQAKKPTSVEEDHWCWYYCSDKVKGEVLGRMEEKTHLRSNNKQPSLKPMGSRCWPSTWSCRSWVADALLWLFLVAAGWCYQQGDLYTKVTKGGSHEPTICFSQILVLSIFFFSPSVLKIFFFLKIFNFFWSGGLFFPAGTHFFFSLMVREILMVI